MEVERGGGLGTCRPEAVADLRVEPAIIAVAVVPVLAFVLQPIFEGVGTLGKARHPCESQVRRPERPCDGVSGGHLRVAVRLREKAPGARLWAASSV